jgi:hypothetical protein
MLQVGDKVLRVEARGGLPRLRSWILCSEVGSKIQMAIGEF